MIFPLIQSRKDGKYPFQISFDLRAIFPGIGGQAEVLHDRQVAKQTPALGDVRDAQLADYLVGRIGEEILAAEHHFGARFGRDEARDRLQGGTLAGAVGPDDAHDLAFVDLKADAVERLDLAIGDGQVFNR